MCQESAEGFIMLLFLASAACLAAIHQAVIGNVCLAAAIALAMPDHEALCVTLFRRVLRSQPAEPLAGNVRCGIVFHAFTTTMRFTAGHKLRGCYLAGITAAAQTSPICPHFRALPALSDDAEVAKGLPQQVVGIGPIRHFFPQTAAAPRSAR